MFFNLYNLYQDIVNYNEIYIYGIGAYSEIIVPKLYDLGLKDKIAGYVLSNVEQEEQFKNGIPVYDVDKLNICTHSCMFIIGVSSLYEREIENVLIRHNYAQYVFLSSYERTDGNAYFRYKNTSVDQYCNNISEWYEFEHSQNLNTDVESEHKKICSVIMEKFAAKAMNLRNCNNKQLVFVIAALYPRIHKMIGALVKRGYDIVMLNMDKASYPYSLCDKELNVKIVSCNCIEEILYESIKYDPLLFYVRPAWINTSLANIMLMQEKFYGKIVLDIHDIAKGTYNLASEQSWLYNIEKEALELADGVVWRYDAQNFLEEKYGYQYGGKSIQFYDYCYDHFIFNETSDDGILRLCWIDSNAECVTSTDAELCQNGVARFANIYELLDKIGSNADCEFHLYVSKITDEGINILNELSKEYSFFKYYVGYTPQEIIKSISKFDYGCELHHSGYILSDAEFIEKGCFYLSGTYENSASNRYFDYLNAGIPLVAVYGRKQIEYLKEYGVLVEMSLENLDIDYLKANKNLYRKNVKESSKFLTISSQIDRLIDFFNSI